MKHNNMTRLQTQILRLLRLGILKAIRRAQKCKIAYIYCAFCNSESSGAPAAEASKSKFATSSYCCVLFMFFSFVQLRELSPVYRGSLGAGAPGDSRGQKCKIAYIYCAFCNSESSKVPNSLYLLCFLQFGEVKSAKQLIFTMKNQYIDLQNHPMLPQKLPKAQ